MLVTGLHQGCHIGRDVGDDLFFLEITPELARKLRLSPDAAKVRLRSKPRRNIVPTRL